MYFVSPTSMIFLTRSLLGTRFSSPNPNWMISWWTNLLGTRFLSLSPNWMSFSMKRLLGTRFLSPSPNWMILLTKNCETMLVKVSQKVSPHSVPISQKGPSRQSNWRIWAMGPISRERACNKNAESWHWEFLGLSGRRVMAELLFLEFGFLRSGPQCTKTWYRQGQIMGSENSKTLKTAISGCWSSYPWRYQVPNLI